MKPLIRITEEKENTEEFEAGAITAEEACVELAHENGVLARQVAHYKSWCYGLMFGLGTCTLILIFMAVLS